MNQSKTFQSNQFEIERQRAMSNIEDVTNSPEDWEDFWKSVDLISDDDDRLKELMSPRINAYVDDVLNGNSIICKRESPLSE